MPHIGLWSSKHAPFNRNSNPLIASGANGAIPAPEAASTHEFARFQHAVRRLKWKLPYLADSHRKATSMLEEHQILEDEKKEIETMFKLDFYEYYTVLEKALVHLLGVWSIQVEVQRSELYVFIHNYAD
jgi:hypothetical protein